MSRPEIIIVAAVALNRVIGIKNKLPWYLPEDLQRFKKLTFGHPVLMGRKTYDSIIDRNKKPLPGRRNIVLTSSKTCADFPQVETYTTFNAALAAVQNEEQVAIIGGASLYQAGLPVADRLELTIVEQKVSGDAWFPEYEILLGLVFELVRSEKRDGFRFESYRRL